jgi:COP9 signalosome complex subunit 5
MSVSLLLTTHPAPEADNGVKTVDDRDLYSYNTAEQAQILEDKPWKKDPHYFKEVRISAVALLKMVMHARSGGSLEVMGLMQGKIMDHAFIVTDAFRLPVEGTETRVNAQDEANEYMVSYLQSSRDVRQLENAVGWYHSHPGYGCWLSGIDVTTQSTHQTHYDPYLAIVIDPDRTVSMGKVDIGAFRTYPDGYKPSGDAATRRTGGGGSGSSSGGGGGGYDEYEHVPSDKIDDFGAHSARYYPLEVTHFKSALDTRLLEVLWRKYWVATLTHSQALASQQYATKQMREVGVAVRKAEKAAAQHDRVLTHSQGLIDQAVEQRNKQMEKVVKEGNKLAAEAVSTLHTAAIKNELFSSGGIAASGVHNIEDVRS